MLDAPTRPRRTSYNDAAQRIGSDDPDPSISLSCVAHGCPLPGAITVDGRRFCFAHLGARDQSKWHGMTAELRRRPAYLRALRVLCQPGARSDAEALDEARELVPAMDPRHDTRYRALVAIESRLLALANGATEPDAAGWPSVEPDPTSVSQMMRDLAAKKAMGGVMRAPESTI